MHAAKCKVAGHPCIFKTLSRTTHSYGVLRIPIPDKSMYSVTNIHEKLIDIEQLKYAHRDQIMTVYDVVSDNEIRRQLNESYLDALQDRTCNISLSLIPNDYAKVFTGIRNFPSVSFDCVRGLNEHVLRLSSNFTCKEIALVLRSYASIGSRSLKTISGLVATFVKKFKDAEVWQIREVAYALAKLKWVLGLAIYLCSVPPKTSDAIAIFYKNAVATLPQHLKHVPGNEIGVFVNSFAKQGIPQDDILHYIEMHTKKVINQSSPKTWALVVNAFAKNHRPSVALCNAISHALLQILESTQHEKYQELNTVDLAIIFNAFSKLDHFDNDLYDKAIPFLLAKLDPDTPNLTLVLLAHAYSQNGIKGHDLYSKIAYLCIHRLDKFNYQQLGMIALAFAKVKYNPELFFLRLADEVIYRGTVGLTQERFEFDFKSLEQLMQAFSRINFKDTRLYSVFTALLKNRLKKSQDDSMDGDMIASLLTSMVYKQSDNFIPFITNMLLKGKENTAYSTVAIARIVDAMNKLRVKHPGILQHFMTETRKRINQFPPSVLITTMKALAKLKGYDPILVKDALKKISMYLVQLTTFDISNLLSALCDFSYRNVSFLKKLIVVINHQLHNFSRQQLHIIFTRLATLRASDATLYNRLITKLLTKQLEFNQVELAEICISYVYVLVHFDYLKRDYEKEQSKPFVTNLLDYNIVLFNTMLSNVGSNMDVGTIFKLQAVHQYLNFARPDVLSRLSVASRQLLEKSTKVKFELAEYFITSSSSHRELSHYLNLLGVVHRNEVPCPPYIIDVVPIVNDGCKYAIEYDGPSHFYAETIMRTAKSILKHELLVHNGYKVIHVPYQEWSQLSNTKQKIIYTNRIKMQLNSGHTDTVTSPFNMQKRCFASDREIRRLRRLNEEILESTLSVCKDEFERSNTMEIPKSEEDTILHELYTSELDGKDPIVSVNKE